MQNIYFKAPLLLLVLISTVSIFNGCKIHKTIDFQTNNISRIEITDDRTIQKTEVQFGEIISFIESQKNEWEKPGLGTYPTPSYTILFYDEKGFIYSLYVGSNWIGISYKDKQYIKSLDHTAINNFLNSIKLKQL